MSEAHDSDPDGGAPEAPSLARRILYSLIPVLAVYAVAEGALTFLWMRGTIEPISTWVYEDNGTGSSYRFDPVLGFALSPVPARMASTATHGTIESVGTIHGNNLGFPDSDDFAPARDGSGRLRLAVMGDSYTAGQYSPSNWPVEAERVTGELDLMNLSIDGGGLLNWSSVLTDLLIAERYELDGVVFAVYGDDLHRGFSFCDDTDGTLLYGTVHASALATPKTLGQARHFMAPVNRWEQISSERFDALLEGEWHPRAGRSFSPWLLRRIARLFGLWELEETWNILPLEKAHFDVMREIGEAARRAQLPLLVVYIPWIEEVRGGTSPVGDPQEVREFARLIGATFLDATPAFSGLDDDQLESCWLPVDGHFSEEGMRTFGEFMGPALLDWTRETGASSPAGAAEVLKRTLAYHDPENAWSTRSIEITAEVSLADRLASERGYSNRTDRIRVDVAAEQFRYWSTKGNDRIEILGDGGTFSARLNGSEEIGAADLQEHRLAADQLPGWRDYFTYVYGMPMKLRDPGTLLDSTVTRTEFNGQDALALRVTYSPEVGQDVWYFYVDPDSFALTGCRFFHDEAANDGEYITFEGEVQGPHGLRLPEVRHWHMNVDGEYIATDEVISID